MKKQEYEPPVMELEEIEDIRTTGIGDIISNSGGPGFGGGGSGPAF